MDMRFFDTGPTLGFLLDTRSWSPLMDSYISKPRCLEYDIRSDQLRKAPQGAEQQFTKRSANR
jgi:hypothetical protein